MWPGVPRLLTSVGYDWHFRRGAVSLIRPVSDKEMSR